MVYGGCQKRQDECGGMGENQVFLLTVNTWFPVLVHDHGTVMMW